MIALFPDDPSWLVTFALALALVAAGVALWAGLEMYTWVLQLLGCEGIRLRWPRRRSNVIAIDQQRRAQLDALMKAGRRS